MINILLQVVLFRILPLLPIQSFCEGRLLVFLSDQWSDTPKLINSVWSMFCAKCRWRWMPPSFWAKASDLWLRGWKSGIYQLFWSLLGKKRLVLMREIWVWVFDKWKIFMSRAYIHDWTAWSHAITMLPLWIFLMNFPCVTSHINKAFVINQKDFDLLQNCTL